MSTIKKKQKRNEDKKVNRKKWRHVAVAVDMIEQSPFSHQMVNSIKLVSVFKQFRYRKLKI